MSGINPKLIEFVAVGAVASFEGPIISQASAQLASGIITQHAFEGIMHQALISGLEIGVAIPFMGLFLSKIGEMIGAFPEKNNPSFVR